MNLHNRVRIFESISFMFVTQVSVVHNEKLVTQF